MIETTVYIVVGIFFLLWLLQAILGTKKSYTVEDFQRQMEEEYDEDRWVAYQEKCEREGREP